MFRRDSSNLLPLWEKVSPKATDEGCSRERQRLTPLEHPSSVSALRADPPSPTGGEGESWCLLQHLPIRPKPIRLGRIGRRVKRRARLGVVNAEDPHGDQPGLFAVEIEVGV